MNLIAAVANDNWCIGRGDELLVRISEDLKNFKRLTSGGVVVVGRKTFETFPNPLPNRVNVVLTRDVNYVAPDGVVVVHDDRELLNFVNSCDQTDVWLIGGQTLYERFVDLCSDAYITLVNVDKTGDKFCPNLDKRPNWRRAEVGPVHVTNNADYRFAHYVNVEVVNNG